MITLPANAMRQTSYGGSAFVVGPIYTQVCADFIMPNMTPARRVPVTDPAGVGEVIFVTQDEYDSIEETASILADEQVMDALRRSSHDIANGNTITSDQLRAQLGL